MSKEKDYKRILANYLKWHFGLILSFIGALTIFVSHSFVSGSQILVDSQTLTFQRMSPGGEILVVLGSAIFTIGLTIIIIEIFFRNFQASENEFIKKGLLHVYDNKKELQEKYSYKFMVSKFDKVIFIGTRHYELTEDLCNQDELVEAILSRSEKFKMEMFFLSPISKHTSLFEQEKGLYGEMLLQDKILLNLKMLLELLESKPGLKSRINIYLYDTAPIGNITFLDNKLAIVNRYNFFEKTQKTFWYVLNGEAVKSQRLLVYYEKFFQSPPKPITSIDELDQYRSRHETK
jgi:hypothetical protein